MEEPKRIVLYPHGRRDEKDYGDFIAGKSICLVGPSAFMQGSKMGKTIDKFDLVVRMNLSCPVPKELNIDIGNRTDILYHVLFTHSHLRSAPDLFKPHNKEEIQSWIDDGVQWVVSKMGFSMERTRKFGPVINGMLPWTCVDRTKYDRLRQETGGFPNMGTIAIYHMLSLPIKSLFVCGCDFHLQGYYKGYGGFNAEQAAKGAGGGRHWGQTEETIRRIHKLEGQVAYIKRALENDKRLTVDDHFKSVLYGGDKE